MYIKIHESYRKVVALCDEDILGMKFEDELRQIEIRENFFKGNTISPSEAVELLRSLKIDDATFNIVGEESVKAALDAGIITEKNTSEIDGVPFALVLL